MKDMDRPVLFLWLKWHYGILRWIPFGGRLWEFADRKVDEWHSRHGR